jgi:hypothetical protein
VSRTGGKFSHQHRKPAIADKRYDLPFGNPQAIVARLPDTPNIMSFRIST